MRYYITDTEQEALAQDAQDYAEMKAQHYAKQLSAAKAQHSTSRWHKCKYCNSSARKTHQRLRVA